MPLAEQRDDERFVGVEDFDQLARVDLGAAARDIGHLVSPVVGSTTTVRKPAGVVNPSHMPRRVTT